MRVLDPVPLYGTSAHWTNSKAMIGSPPTGEPRRQRGAARGLGRRYTLVQVEVRSVESAALFVCFEQVTKAEFLLVNASRRLVYFSQALGGGIIQSISGSKAMRDLLLPGQQCEYAWQDPLRARKRLRFSVVDKGGQQFHCSCDISRVKQHPPLPLSGGKDVVFFSTEVFRGRRVVLITDNYASRVSSSASAAWASGLLGVSLVAGRERHAVALGSAWKKLQRSFKKRESLPSRETRMSARKIERRKGFQSLTPEREEIRERSPQSSGGRRRGLVDSWRLTETKMPTAYGQRGRATYPYIRRSISAGQIPGPSLAKSRAAGAAGSALRRSTGASEINAVGVSKGSEGLVIGRHVNEGHEARTRVRQPWTAAPARSESEVNLRDKSRRRTFGKLGGASGNESAPGGIGRRVLSSPEQKLHPVRSVTDLLGEKQLVSQVQRSDEKPTNNCTAGKSSRLPPEVCNDSRDCWRASPVRETKDETCRGPGDTASAPATAEPTRCKRVPPKRAGSLDFLSERASLSARAGPKRLVRSWSHEDRLSRLLSSGIHTIKSSIWERGGEHVKREKAVWLGAEEITPTEKSGATGQHRNRLTKLASIGTHHSATDKPVPERSRTSSDVVTPKRKRGITVRYNAAPLQDRVHMARRRLRQRRLARSANELHRGGDSLFEEEDEDGDAAMLQPQQGGLDGKGFNASAPAKPAGGAKPTVPKFAELQIYLSLHLEGCGFSLVDSLPQELAYIAISGVEAAARRTKQLQTGATEPGKGMVMDYKLAVRNFQVDNGVPGAWSTTIVRLATAEERLRHWGADDKRGMTPGEGLVSSAKVKAVIASSLSPYIVWDAEEARNKQCEGLFFRVQFGGRWGEEATILKYFDCALAPLAIHVELDTVFELVRYMLR